jgi:hypothetical protein
MYSDRQHIEALDALAQAFHIVPFLPQRNAAKAADDRPALMRPSPDQRCAGTL